MMMRHTDIIKLSHRYLAFLTPKQIAKTACIFLFSKISQISIGEVEKKRKHQQCLRAHFISNKHDYCSLPVSYDTQKNRRKYNIYFAL